MLRLSVFLGSLLVSALLFSAPVAGEQPWPIDREIDLSGGFMDFRDGHFHGGIDFRTGGKIGAMVTSPVDGYVWRVKMSYYGYGKGLYIMGDDGYLYVFGHLSKFPGIIDKPVKQAQIAAGRYYLDLYFPKDSIRVSKGDFLAYSGQTGVGAPHLHFEKRAVDNIPVNPLTHGYKLSDNIRPVFERIGFQMIDDRSLFDHGKRKIHFDLVQAEIAGHYRLDTMLYFHRPFGILVDGYDMMRQDGMKQTIYRLAVYVDGDLFYEVRFDSLDYEASSAVRLEYDYQEAVNGHPWVRRLFTLVGNSYSGRFTADSGSGVYGLQGMERIGLHQVRIVGEDCSGNRSEIAFEFLWGPPGNVFELDSVVTCLADTTMFFFTSTDNYEALGIDSVLALRNKGREWGKPRDLTVLALEEGRIACVVVGRGVESAVLRLFVFAGGDGLIRDNLFNGLQHRAPDRCDIDYEVVEDGLLVTVKARTKRGAPSRLELYYQDSLLGIEYPCFFEMVRHICFIPPRPEYARIDRIGVTMTLDTTHKVTVMTDSLAIFAVGYEQNQEVRVDDFLTLYFDEKTFYRPRFIELRKNDRVMRVPLQLNSAHYQVFPEVFVCRENYEMSLRITNLAVNDHPSGICWLDEKENRWVWLDNTLEGDMLRAESYGGGSFVALFDYDPPEISHLNILDGHSYYGLQPRIYFQARDTISGVDDDQDIVIKLDGQWMIPEYDPESYRCVTRPIEPLTLGKHHLGIRVTDRAGNLSEQYLNFFIKSKMRRQRH